MSADSTSAKDLNSGANKLGQGNPADSKHPASKHQHSSPHDQKTDAHAQAADDPARKAYEAAQAAYQKELGVYWKSVEAAKQASKKVTDFPPFYKGPEKPPNYDPPKEPSTLPSVNDMTHAWSVLAPIASGHPKQHGLPDLKIEEVSESAFKQAYAREALAVGNKYGLKKSDTQNIVQSIYAFEDAGKGTADQLSGVPFRLTVPDPPGSHANRDERRAIHPLSTAIGYNQLLTATSLQFVDGSSAIDTRLNELAKSDHARSGAILSKEKLFAEVKSVLHKELISFAQKDKGKYLDAHGHPTYALYTDFARSSIVTGTGGLTGRQLSSGIQALNLDRDVGPVLQAQELNELFGHGLDPAFKSMLDQKSQDDQAAAEAFQRLPGSVKADAVDALLDRTAPGWQGAASSPADILRNHLLAFTANPNTALTKDSLGEPAYDLLMSKVMSAKKYGDTAGPLGRATQALVDALFVNVMNHPSGDAYLAAAVELANLAGTANADEMLKHQNAAYPTVNFFDRSGYQANGITNGRSADELVKAIYRSMHGINGSPQNYGMADMSKAFNSQ